MNFGQLQTLVSVWLDDVNFGYFSQAQVKVWLNNAQIEAQKLLLEAGQNYYVQRWQTSLVVNQSDYILPSDFMKLHRLELVVSGTVPNETVQVINPVTLNQQDLISNTQDAYPAYYYIKRNRLVLLPYPQQVLTMRMYYSPEVADMVNDSDVPDVPAQYHEYLAVLAALDGFLKDQRDPSQFLEKRRYYEKMMKDDATERNVDMPRAIVETGQNSGYVYGFY